MSRARWSYLMPEPIKPAFVSRQVEEGRYFFLDLKPKKSAGLTVVCAGREKCASNYFVSRESFPYHALEYVASGRGAVTLNGRKYPIGPGSVFTYRPDTSHRIRSVGSGRLVKYFIDFAGHQAGQLLDAAHLSPGHPHRIDNTRWLQANFDQLLACGNGPRETAQQQCVHLLHLILLHVRAESIPGDAKGIDAYKTYTACRALIEERYIDLHTVREVAEMVGIDPSYLSRVFQRFAREKPYQFLIRMKMDHAAELLTQGRSVAQAGEAVGFIDPYHFSRVFKRTHGLAPTKFIQASGRAASLAPLVE